MLFLFEVPGTESTIRIEFPTIKDAEEAAVEFGIKLLGEFIEEGEVHSTVLQ